MAGTTEIPSKPPGPGPDTNTVIEVRTMKIDEFNAAVVYGARRADDPAVIDGRPS